MFFESLQTPFILSPRVTGRSLAKLWPACRIFVLLFLQDRLRTLQNPKFWKTAPVHFLCDC
jgi:hypothetical protein